jgi:hypothetical protein
LVCGVAALWANEGEANAIDMNAATTVAGTIVCKTVMIAPPGMSQALVAGGENKVQHKRAALLLRNRHADGRG